MTDKVFIQGLEVFTIIGVYSWEKQYPRKLLLDMDIEFDNSRAGKTDNLELALNYHAVSESVKALCESSKYNLLEKLAEEVWNLLKNDFNVNKASIKINKPGAVSGVHNLGIVINRQV